MKSFSALIDRLNLTSDIDEQLAILAVYFEETPNPSCGYAIGILSGEISLPRLKLSQIQEQLLTLVDTELYELSKSFAKDTTDTISLMWPTSHGANAPTHLDLIITSILDAKKHSLSSCIYQWMDRLEPPQRWLLIKMMTGNFPFPVTSYTQKKSLSACSNKSIDDILEVWPSQSPPYTELFNWLKNETAPRPCSKFSDFYAPHRGKYLLKNSSASHGLQQIDLQSDYSLEWKWVGQRVQLRTGPQTTLYTHHGDEITKQFPELQSLISQPAILDGIIILRTKDNTPCHPDLLEKRLKSKTISAKSIADALPHFIAFDILFDDYEDLRKQTFRQRRQRLEKFIVSSLNNQMSISPLLPFTDLNDIHTIKNSPPNAQMDGVVLKANAATYNSGDEKHAWLKLKRSPFTLKAVLMYVERSRSSRASNASFGVWQTTEEDGKTLVSIGKTELNLSTEDQQRLTTYVKANTLERFGPVTSIKADSELGIVLNVSFEKISASSRHKSGLKIENTKLLEICWNDMPCDANTLLDMHSLTTTSEISN